MKKNRPGDIPSANTGLLEETPGIMNRWTTEYLSFANFGESQFAHV